MGPSIQSERRSRSGRGRSTRLFRPILKDLEDRLLLTLAPVLTALTTYHYWIDYAPSYDSSGDPYNSNPTDAQITADLTNLYQEGFRGLVTYTLLGSYADIPKIAKSVGFLWVIAGVYDPTNATEVDTAASPNVLPYTDAFVVGNEGLTDNRYTYTQLTTAIDEVKAMTGKPVTTSEPGGAYYTPNGSSSPYAAQLLGLGDWLFPNIDYFLWAGQPSTPQFMWSNVSFVYQFMMANQTTPGPVVAKEIAYPSAGGLQASDANQISWYHDYAAANQVAGDPFYFVYFEAYDQPWKSSIDAYEPHMGLNAINNPNGTSQPKPAVTQLQADIMSAYPGTDVPQYASKQGLALTEAPGVPFAATVAEFTDPNDPIGSNNDVYSASILWGDGGGFERANVSISQGTLMVSAGHTYSAPGQYTVQVALQRSSGYGEVVQTEASVSRPAATAEAATAISTTGATLNATVDPAGSATTFDFVYGTNPTLTTGTTTAVQSAGSGTSPETETAALSGLTPNTTYYFEVQATNASGTTASSILSFTTAANLAILQFSSGQFVANVTAGSGQVVLTRSGNLSASVTIVLSSPGGDEVTPFSEMVTLGSNVQSQTVSVPIVNNGQPGRSNTVIPLSLSSPGPGATLGVTGSANLVIVDNNPFPPPVVITSLQTPTIKAGTGKKAKSEVVIQLQFSGPVNGAGNLGAYRIQLGKTKKGVTRYTKAVRLTSARYDASTYAVDLVPRSKQNLPAPERLTVTASLITDTLGRPLDGNIDGQPGGNFVAVFSKKGVTIEQTKRPSASTVDALFARGRLGHGFTSTRRDSR